MTVSFFLSFLKYFLFRSSLVVLHSISIKEDRAEQTEQVRRKETGVFSQFP